MLFSFLACDSCFIIFIRQIIPLFLSMVDQKNFIVIVFFPAWQLVIFKDCSHILGMLLLGFIYRNYKIWNNFPQTSFLLHTYFCGMDDIGYVHIATQPLGSTPWCYNPGESRQWAGGRWLEAILLQRWLTIKYYSRSDCESCKYPPHNSNNLYLKLNFPLTGTSKLLQPL